MEARLRIKEAVEFYNSVRLPEFPAMTLASLAQVVFRDKKSKTICKEKLFNQIANNHRKFVDLNWLITISESTGFPVQDLIEFY